MAGCQTSTFDVLSAGAEGGHCPKTGKRQYTSRKQALKGMRRRTNDSLGTYVCPHCHYHHLRNSDRFGKPYAGVDPRDPMGKKSKRKQKQKKRRPKVCTYCFEGHPDLPKRKGPRVVIAAKYLGRNICNDCLGLLRQGPAGRFKLVSALEEAARIRGSQP